MCSVVIVFNVGGRLCAQFSLSLMLVEDCVLGFHFL